MGNCGKPATFIVLDMDNEWGARVCDNHLVPAVRHMSGLGVSSIVHTLNPQSGFACDGNNSTELTKEVE